MNSSPEKRLLGMLSNSLLARFLLLFLSACALILILDYFQNVIFLFTFGAIVAFLLSYPAAWLNRYLPHGLAVTLVFIIGISIITGITVTVIVAILSQGQQLVESLIQVINSLVPLVEEIEKSLRERNIPIDLDLIRTKLNDEFLKGLSIGFSSSLSTLQFFFANFINFIFITVIAFFMLLDGEKLWSFFVKLLPTHQQGRFNYLIRRNLLAFFRGQIILCLFLTTVSFIIFLILQVPFPLLLAVTIGVFDLIPGIGATLGGAIVVLVILSQKLPWLAIQVFIALIIIQQIQDNLIAPRIMRGSLNINPVVIFFALLVGYKVAGLLGVFMAIPIAGLVVSWFEIDEMKAE
jgi:predicted PurR-regulated permease PerM